MATDATQETTSREVENKACVLAYQLCKAIRKLKNAPLSSGEGSVFFELDGNWITLSVYLTNATVAELNKQEEKVIRGVLAHYLNTPFRIKIYPSVLGQHWFSVAALLPKEKALLKPEEKTVVEVGCEHMFTLTPNESKGKLASRLEDAIAKLAGRPISSGFYPGSEMLLIEKEGKWLILDAWLSPMKGETLNKQGEKVIREVLASYLNTPFKVRDYPSEANKYRFTVVAMTKEYKVWELPYPIREEDL